MPVVERSLAALKRRQTFGSRGGAPREVNQERVLCPTAAAVGDTHIDMLRRDRRRRIRCMRDKARERAMRSRDLIKEHDKTPRVVSRARSCSAKYCLPCLKCSRSETTCPSSKSSKKKLLVLESDKGRKDLPSKIDQKVPNLDNQVRRWDADKVARKRAFPLT